MEKLCLNGVWELSGEGLKRAYPVGVPGSVLSGLLENGVIQDPYFRENEYAARDLFWEDYTFERAFTVTGELLSRECVDLVACGLDTLTEIYINGALLARTDNMHRTWRIPAGQALRPGENRIRIKCLSPLKYIKNYRPAENKENVSVVPCGGIKGDQYLRKAHSMFGWDWGAQLPDAGIYRDIGLEAYDVTRLEDVEITQEHGDGAVTVTAGIQLQIPRRELPLAAEEAEVGLNLRAPDGSAKTVRGRVICGPCGFARTELKIRVEHPSLWWPNGYGEQPLYKLTVSLCLGGLPAEEKAYTLGLRTMKVSRSKDEWGSEFAFEVNGVKIFARGANYIPEDCVYSRIIPERTDALLRSCVWANFNCIRVWGGGYYPSDDFYESCDAYGLIVWQDLMYACNVYELTEDFARNITAETYDVVRRLRHHPSLGLWCGNNEMETGWCHWTDFNEETDYLRADYVKMFEYILPKAVKSCDSQTFYWPSSPSSGGSFDEPDDENRGDVHYWAVWHGQKPFTDYRNYYFRFCSEFGFQSFPCLKTVNTYTLPEDRNIFSGVMESHQKNTSANGKILYYLSENFRYPDGFDNLLYVSQILQGAAIKSGVEHWRRNRGRCMGALYWQLNDNWPVASWSSVDYFGRFKALHYMARKFYAPCAGSLLLEGGKAQAWVQNETDGERRVSVTLRFLDVEGNTLWENAFRTVAAPFSAAMAGEADCGEILARYGARNVFAEAAFCVEGNRQIQTEAEAFAPYKHMNLLKPHIRVQAREEGEAYVLSLFSDRYAPFVELDFAEYDAVFSDNYFTLPGGEGACAVREIILERGGIRTLSGETAVFASAEELAGALRVRSLRDTYE